MLKRVAAILHHRQRTVPCNPGIYRGVPRLSGVQQLEDDHVLLGADVLFEFSQGDFLVAHCQLPPEAHQLPAFVLIAVIGQTVLYHVSSGLLLPLVAKAFVNVFEVFVRHAFRVGEGSRFGLERCGVSQ
jgi:hypothetical protein